MTDVIQTLNELKQQRMKVVEDQKAIAMKAAEEKRALNSDEELAYQKAEEDFNALEGQIRMLEEIEARATQMQAQYEQNITTTQQEPTGPDYRSVFEKYVRYGLQELTAEEKNLLRKNYDSDKETRAQTVTTSGGGYAIPEGFAGRVETVLKYYGPMLDENVVTIMRTASGNDLPYPTLDDTSNTGRLLAINTAVTTTDLTFGVVTLKSYKFSSDQILVPWELLQDEQVDLTGVIGDQLGQRLGRVTNTYLTTGTGSAQPNGVVNATSAGKTASSATAITRSEIIDLIHSVDRAYRVGNKVGFMMHDSILAAIKKLTIGSGDDRPLWQPSIVAGEPDRLEGFPYWINNDMDSTLAASKKVLLFGDFSKYLVRVAGPTRFRRLEERYAESDQVGFFGLLRLDGNLIASGSIKHLITASA